jgi:hypothetical protein
MSNITLSLKDELIKAGREYAKAHQTSLNNLIRMLLQKTVYSSNKKWLEESFTLMDRSKADSKGGKWRREDLYDVYYFLRYQYSHLQYG